MRWQVVVLRTAMLLIIQPPQSSGQGKVTFSPGVGFPELINAGFRYQVAGQSKIGLSVGWWPPSLSGSFFSWGHLVSYTGDFYAHFGRPSELSRLRPWFARIGISHIRDSGYPYLMFLYLRIGGEINFDTRNGLSIDGGFGYNVIPKYTGVTVMPVTSISYYHRF